MSLLMERPLRRRSEDRRDTADLTSGWLAHHTGNGWLGLAVIGSAIAAGIGLGLRPIYGLAAAAAIVVGLVVLARPAAGGYILVGVVPIVSGLKRGFPVPGVRLAEALIASIGLVILLTASHRQTVKWRVADWLLLTWATLWCGVGGFDVVVLHQHLDTRTVEQLAGPFQFVLLYRAVVTALPLKTQRQRGLGLFLLASVPVSLLAIAQQFHVAAIQRTIARATGGDVFNTYSYHYFARATGPFPHWTPLAGYLFIVLVTGFALLLEGEGPLHRRQLVLVLTLAAAGLVLTAELSAMGGTVISLLVLGAWYGRLGRAVRWLLVGSIGMLATFSAYLKGRFRTQFGTNVGSTRKSWVPQSLDYRWQVWTRQYIPVIKQRPLTGWGPRFPLTISWPFTESQYITLLMDGGVVVLIAYVAMMIALYIHAIGVARMDGEQDTDRHALARALAVIIVVLMAMNTIFPYFTAGGLPEPFWVVAALVMGALRPGRAWDHIPGRRLVTASPS